MTEPMPPYSDLIRPAGGRGRRPSELTDSLHHLPPGGVLEVPLNGRTPNKRSQALSTIIQRLNKKQPGLARRSRDGRLFVIRLRPEDMP